MGEFRKIETEIIPFTTEADWLAERAKDITSTQVSALFDSCPYMTKFELYHQHKGAYDREFNPTERTKWGNRLEAAIADAVAEEQGWNIRPMKEYIRHKNLRAGSSFDFGICDILPDGKPGPVQAILEIKNVDSIIFKTEWAENDDGTFEAPLHIEFQVQQQMWLTNLPKAYIAALVGGNRMILIERERDQGVIDAIEEKITEFFDDVENEREPDANFQKDMGVIAQLYGYAQPGKVIEGTDQVRLVASEYKRVSDEIKKLETEKAGYKAEMLELIEDAEKVVGDGFSISARVVEPKWIESYEKRGYRDFRVFWKKGARK